MGSKPLDGLVGDWGGFEKLIASLHETGDITVEHDVELIGRSGAPRKIDVLLRHRQGLYEHLTVIECKYWKENVPRQVIDALHTTVGDLNASRGVVFSAAGFQEGALTAAKHYGIDLFRVRELDEDEWGAPGRVVDLILQVISGSIGKVQLEEVELGLVLGATAPNAVELNMGFNENGPYTSTALLGANGAPPNGTLEERILSAAQKMLHYFTSGNFRLPGEPQDTAFWKGNVTLLPKSQWIVQIPGSGPPPAFLLLKKLTFELGIQINQTAMRIDRAAAFKFAVAIENCITGNVAKASRRPSDIVTVLEQDEDTIPGTETPLQNGSVLKVYLKPLVPIYQLKNPTPVPAIAILSPASGPISLEEYEIPSIPRPSAMS